MKVIVHPPTLLCSECGSHLLGEYDHASRTIHCECASLHCANHGIQIAVPVAEVEGVVVEPKS